MQKLFKITLCCILYGYGMSAVAQTAEVLKLQQLLDNIKSMRADFTQQVYSEQKKLLHTYTGTVEFKKPCQLRWQVEQPDNTLLVTDGKKVWNYDAMLEQVSIHKYSSANNEITPLSFILDDSNNIEHNFVVTAKGQNCFKLIPKKDNANFVHVSVCFKNAVLYLLEIYDHLGQTSTFNFVKIENNIKIPDSRFIFNPPAGVDVIGEQ